ncbi:DUF4405 domain-containing protein [Candidatus Woesearchaeota archaeon]|nr:DUF4405 domain-containing protein [Candidatus Woesearchaeota archaeon]
MENPKINYWVDICIFISFIVTAVSGLVILFFLPSGVRRGGFQELLGGIKSAWVDVHNCAGIIMVVLCVVHVVLHWKWAVYMTKVIFSKKKGK